MLSSLFEKLSSMSFSSRLRKSLSSGVLAISVMGVSGFG